MEITDLTGRDLAGIRVEDKALILLCNPEVECSISGAINHQFMGLHCTDNFAYGGKISKAEFNQSPYEGSNSLASLSIWIGNEIITGHWPIVSESQSEVELVLNGLT